MGHYLHCLPISTYLWRLTRKWYHSASFLFSYFYSVPSSLVWLSYRSVNFLIVPINSTKKNLFTSFPHFCFNKENDAEVCKCITICQSTSQCQLEKQKDSSHLHCKHWVYWNWHWLIRFNRLNRSKWYLIEQGDQ